MKKLFVGGTFNNDNGKSSKIANEVFANLHQDNFDFVNGGNVSQLEDIIHHIKDFQLIYWFANVSNDEPKLVREIKRINSECILVTSKRNVEKKYDFADLIYHSLNIKSNLAVEITQQQEKYLGRVFDPLGNVFLDHTSNFGLVGKVLEKRTNELLSFTRMPSANSGEKIEAPNDEEFFSIVRTYGEVFHKLVHANPELVHRFFGNASFRCEKGFPSFRKDNLIYVSRRNVDKRDLGKESFVAVQNSLPLNYFGHQKPSVDTPIQVLLYNFYPNINYMLHSHVYINGAPFTKRVIPCGAVEEATEIKELFPDETKTNFAVNLRGHGSLILARDKKYLQEIDYVPRTQIEVHQNYLSEE